MLYSTKINDFGSTELGVYGVSILKKVLLRYFCSLYKKSAYGSKLTGEICNSYSDLDSVRSEVVKEFKKKKKVLYLLKILK
jgi:hypothetical protein